MRTTMTLSVLAAVVLASGATLAADPPGLMNYQGVLRDDTDVPLDGTYDMIFRFFDDADPADPENEIFVDEHLAAGTGAVTVTGGLFDVLLGSGNFYDGTGPGDHPHIFYVFGLHETVYLEVQVGAERLQPRMQVVSAPYAVHAMVLGGYVPNDFINTTSDEQEKIGLLRALGGIDFGDGDHDDLTANEVTHLTSGPATYADFLHQHAYADNADTVDNKHASEFADAVHGHNGSEITGPVAEAADADTLDTYHSSYFLNTSSTPQSKSGPLTVDAVGAGSTALEVVGDNIGGFFSINAGTGWANVATGDRGIQGFGEEAGGYFKDSDSSGEAYVGYGHHGVWATGSTSGGFFEDFEGSGFAWVGYGDRGIQSIGAEAGGYFYDSDGTSNAYLAYGGHGIEASGQEAGGYFSNSTLTDLEARLAFDDGLGGVGVSAHGGRMGGEFSCCHIPLSEARVATSTVGIDASGLWDGGHFSTSAGGGSAEAYVGHDHGSGRYYGIWALGDTAAGYFEDSGGLAQVYLAKHDPTLGPGATGISAEGQWMGGTFSTPPGIGGTVQLAVKTLDPGPPIEQKGYGILAEGTDIGGDFRDTANSTVAILANNSAGQGVFGGGERAGGYFYNNGAGTAFAYLGRNYETDQYYGIWAEGNTAAGYFEDSDGSGYAFVGYSDEGISAHGNVQGGYFERDGTGYYTHVAYGTNKVQGPGSNSFVQNHPYEKDRVLVYNSPEGDEVATYTRGTARLLGGEARVPLGETFSWVSNPDIGLTAYITPVGDWSDLYIAEKSATELVVRSRDGAPDVAFDYIVYGLRIGFEEVSIVQEKHLEARIPSMFDHAQRYERHPELRAFNALERFKKMESDVLGIDAAQLDFSRAAALEAAIEVYDPNVHGQVIRPRVGEASADGGHQRPAPGPEEAGSDSAPEPGSKLARTGEVLVDRHETIEESTEPTAPTFAVSGPVGPGDLLVLDPENPGQLRRADTAADPNVIGIAAAKPIEMGGELQVEMVDSLYTVVKADATYGVILAGDLLTSSPTPGHVMVAVSPAPGEVVGKAAESLESGTGSIRVLVMPR